ncbi:AAA family ATPase [Emticicia fontis]
MHLADKLTSDFFSKAFDFRKKQQKIDESELEKKKASFMAAQIEASRNITIEDFRVRILENLNFLVKERNPDKSFLLDEFSKRSFELFLQYFHPGSQTVLNRQKGICLLGPVGTGKSTLLTAFKDNPFASFRIVKAQEIVESYVDNPEATINRMLAEKSLPDQVNEYGFTRYEILIEEVGREQLSVIPRGDAYKSTPVNVMERIFMELYDRPNVRVHMISNAEIKGTEKYVDKLSAIYGKAAGSRIYDKFNVITQDPNSPNRRFT